MYSAGTISKSNIDVKQHVKSATEPQPVKSSEDNHYNIALYNL